MTDSQQAGLWGWSNVFSHMLEKIFSRDNALAVDSLAGVPSGFTKITSNTTTFNIEKGRLNHLGFYPRILNEQQINRQQVQGIVTSTNIVGQAFKPSKNNISALMFAGGSDQGTAIDDFESYADDAAIQAVWSTSGANLAELETDTGYTGSKAMRLPTNVDAEEWTRTAPGAPLDYTGYTGLFKAIFTHPINQLQIAVFIEDNVGNSKSFPIVQDGAGILCSCEVNEAAMVDDQATVTDTANIAVIGYRVLLKRAGSFVRIDDLAAVPAPGFLGVKLWDMGTEIPVSATTRIDDGDQYTQIGGMAVGEYVLSLEGGNRVYHLEDLTAGIDKSDPNNISININNYYIIEFKWIDTDVSIYGADTSLGKQFYVNGFAFTAPDEATPITAISEFSDIMFGVYSTQEVYLTNVGWAFDNAPNGGSSILATLRDLFPKTTDTIVDHEEVPEKDFDFNLSERPMYLLDGGHMGVDYNDDPLDSVNLFRGEFTFLYKPPVVNG